VSEEGVLELRVPTSLPEGEVDVLLIVRPAENTPADRWPESFFENTCGHWIGKLERPAIEDYEVRPTLDDGRCNKSGGYACWGEIVK
jgi:hypothetical protein